MTMILARDDVSIRPGAYIFARTRRPVANVADMLDRMTARAGIPDTHPHALRHTFATEFVRNGGNPADLQEILGHTTATMSLRYAKSNPERLKAALRRAARYPWPVAFW